MICWLLMKEIYAEYMQIHQGVDLEPKRAKWSLGPSGPCEGVMRIFLGCYRKKDVFGYTSLGQPMGMILATLGIILGPIALD